MKRTPLRRSSGLSRSSRLRPRSKKTARVYVGRREFVRRTLGERPVCEIQLSGCRGRSVDVHEFIPRSKGGAIVPGPEADAQGQRFLAVCRACHDEISTWTGRARELGFLR